MGWFNANWGYRKKITIDNAKVSGTGNLTDFPVLINFTDADFKDTGNGGHVGKSNGGDILFTAADETTQLKHELQQYTNTSGLVIAWVKIPTLDYNDDTEIYVYYGNAAAADQEDPANVWSTNYEAVWHMNQANIIDSTSNNHDGTNSGTVDIAGKIGQARDFEEADSDYISVGTWDVDGAALTISGWAQFEAGTDLNMFGKSTGFATGDILFKVSTSNAGPGINVNFFLRTGTTTTRLISSFTATTGVWYYIVCRYDGTNMTIRMNKSASGSTGKTGSIPTATHGVQFGRNSDNINNANMDGPLDEWRVYLGSLITDWSDTEYDNQNSPGTFYSVGAEEEGGWSAGKPLGVTNPGKILNVDIGNVGKFLGV